MPAGPAVGTAAVGGAAAEAAGAAASTAAAAGGAEAAAAAETRWERWDCRGLGLDPDLAAGAEEKKKKTGWQINVAAHAFLNPYQHDSNTLHTMRETSHPEECHQDAVLLHWF